MRLVLIRHAAAVNIAASDAERALTAEGREHFTQVVAGLGVLGIELHRILHSPFRRARETAELCRPLLARDAATREAVAPCEELAQAPTERLLRRLDPDLPALALVGHEPWMGELLARLTVGETRPGARLAFRKGSVAVLDGPPAFDAMSLHGFYPPEVTRALAREAP